MNLKKLSLSKLKQVAQRLGRKVCCGYCDQLNGVHQGECHGLSRIRHGIETRVTYIRPFLARVKRKLDNSGL